MTNSPALPDPASPRDVVALIDRLTVAVESMRTQWRALVHLGTHERMTLSQLRIYGAMPMSELASRISLSRAAVTSLVDRLEADGWVRRTADPHDRRRTVLDMQPRAIESYDEVSTGWTDFVTGLSGDLDDASFALVNSFLVALTREAEQTSTRLRTTAGQAVDAPRT